MLAIRRTPEFNATWDDAAGEIVVKHYVNLGIAAATPRGLMVPNIKNADQLPLVDLARALTALTQTAREGKTPPADMQGTTFTITNVGVFGVDGGTPILNPGESGHPRVRCDPQAAVGRRRRGGSALGGHACRCRSTTGSSTANRGRVSSPTSPASWKTPRTPCSSSEHAGDTRAVRTGRGGRAGASVQRSAGVSVCVKSTFASWSRRRTVSSPLSPSIDTWPKC